MRNPRVLMSVDIFDSADAVMPKPVGYRRMLKQLKAMFAEGHERERRRCAALPKANHNARETALRWLEERRTGYKWKPEPSVE